MADQQYQRVSAFKEAAMLDAEDERPQHHSCEYHSEMVQALCVN